MRKKDAPHAESCRTQLGHGPSLPFGRFRYSIASVQIERHDRDPG